MTFELLLSSTAELVEVHCLGNFFLKFDSDTWTGHYNLHHNSILALALIRSGLEKNKTRETLHKEQASYMYCCRCNCGLVILQKFVTWPRGLKLACACYLASTSISEPETKTPWVARAPKNKDPLKWFVMACSRLSQTGEYCTCSMVISCAKNVLILMCTLFECVM